MAQEMEVIRKEGRLLFEYVAGSHLYGLNNQDSDVDTKGIYTYDPKDVLSLPLYTDNGKVADERNDNVWYEIGRFMELLTKSNPTILEALFVPEDKVITKPSKALNELFAHRMEFVTQACFPSFVSYAEEQIRKARGLNKKIVNPITERKTPFDFTYTFRGQGSTKVKNWLDDRGLNKDFCGLVNVPNMHDVYAVYYDWGSHFKHYGITLDIMKSPFDGAIARMFKKYDITEEVSEIVDKNLCYLSNEFGIVSQYTLSKWYKENDHELHYRGMCLEDSNEMRHSSVEKGAAPIMYMSYNEDGYKAHCKKYREYKEWERMRNPKRYESNLDKTYDSKNMMHCFRLMHMGIEIAEGEGLILDRSKRDGKFLLDVRNHKFEYDELITMLDEDKDDMTKAILNTKIKKDVDPELAKHILKCIRWELIGGDDTLSRYITNPFAKKG